MTEAAFEEILAGRPEGTADTVSAPHRQAVEAGEAATYGSVSRDSRAAPLGLAQIHAF